VANERPDVLVDKATSDPQKGRTSIVGLDCRISEKYSRGNLMDIETEKGQPKILPPTHSWIVPQTGWQGQLRMVWQDSGSQPHMG
jgi:hypothetical protein